MIIPLFGGSGEEVMTGWDIPKIFFWHLKFWSLTLPDTYTYPYPPWAHYAKVINVKLMVSIMSLDVLGVINKINESFYISLML